MSDFVLLMKRRLDLFVKSVVIYKRYIVWYNKINKIKLGINWQFFYWSDLKSHICKYSYDFILITYFNIYCKIVQLDYLCQNVCNQTTKCISLLLEFMYFRRTFKIKLILLLGQWKWCFCRLKYFCVLFIYCYVRLFVWVFFGGGGWTITWKYLNN